MIPEPGLRCLPGVCGNKPGIVIGKTDAEAEAPTLWSPDVKNQLIGKDCYAEKV